MTTVVVAGAVANKHRHGGSVWVRMSWAEALRELGYDVVFVEQIDSEGFAGRPARVFSEVMERFGFTASSALVNAGDGSTLGLSRGQLLDRLEHADALVNISGHLRDPDLLGAPRLRVYVDLDPGFTQIWHAEGGAAPGLAGHDHHFTVGANVGTDACDLPTGGIAWKPIRQPVVARRWPVPPGGFTGFTTVASWRGAYGPPAWKGHQYGLKVHQFRRFLDLPRATGLPFSAALEIHPDEQRDLAALQDGGWRLVDASRVAGVDGFRRFVSGSGAEFSPAQGVYVESRSGWFSDRTVRYLAAGRPALVQDTGWTEHLPSGEGLVAFGDLDEAAAGAHAIARDYPRHRAAAREIAERCFTPEVALAPLLELL